MKLQKSVRLLVPIVCFLAFWEIISRSGIFSISLFPPPSLVFVALIGLFKNGFWFDIAASLVRVLGGLLLGSISGVIIGISTARFKIMDTSLTPLINLFRALPPVAIIPLIILWFGIGETAKIISIAFAVFFPVWVNTHTGAQRVAHNYLRIASTLTKSKFKILYKVIFPSTLPFAIAGVRIGIAVAFIMIFVSELAGASHGLGYQISVSHLNYAIDKMIAALFTLGLLAALTDMIFDKVTRKVFPWIQKI